VTTAAPVTTRMRAAVLEAPGRTTISELARPEPKPGETLVRIEGCGVCASDFPVWEGRSWFDYPLEPGAPGHEGWGIDVETGQRVALLSHHAYAEYEAVPSELVVPLPPELDGMAFPAEPLGCALNVFSRSGVRDGRTVAVVGTGFLGLLLVQLCVGAGAHTLAFSRRESALERARVFGAETPVEVPEESCDVVIEAGGVQETLDLASRLVGARGRLVIAGFHQDGPRTVDLQSWNWRGLDVVNAHERDPFVYLEAMRAAVGAVIAGELDPRPLYTHVLPLERVDEAFELMRTRPDDFVKALVVPS
jgi:threonine dehydrogenase-like Zn-dependent dehydrogenase